MRFKAKPKFNYIAYFESWHPAFVWFPRRIGDEWVWLETVQCRVKDWHWGDVEWEYQIKKSV